jgi:hypothetical protein
MNGYDQQSLAFMAEARKMPPSRMPEPATTKPPRPRETVNNNVAEAIGADDLEFLLQYFEPRDDRHTGDHAMGDDEEWDGEMCEAPLNAKRRNALDSGNFALPGRRYPIDTPARARAALSRVEQFGSSSEKSKVRAAVKRKYPNMDVTAPSK